MTKYLEALERVKNNLEHHYPENIRDFNAIKEALQALEILKKHFNFKFDDDGFMLLVSIQSKEDADTWDTTASANIQFLNYRPLIYNENAMDEFNVLKEVFK